MARNKLNLLALGAVGLLGLLALVQHWVAGRRPLSPELRAAQEFQVTSGADRGPGSLREAIFAADSARQRARIVVRTSRIILQSPLPPLVNPLGIIIEAGGNQPEIEAAGIGPGAALDVNAPNSAISGIRISNAPEQGLLVRAEGLRLSNIRVTGCDVGVLTAEGIQNFVVENSGFEGNRIGIWLTAANPGFILRNNNFKAHKDAAVWAVRPNEQALPQSSRFALRGNHFESDRMSVVLGNMPALIEDNEFVKAREAALYLIGQGAVVRGNRIRNGAGIGVFAHTTQGTVIEDNEMDHNRALAVLVRSSSSDLVQKNRVYDNGYGIGFVLGERQRPNVAAGNILLSQQFDGIIVIGDSPIIRGNRAMNNSLAGLRVLDFLPLSGARVVSDPFIDNNTMEGNKSNQPVRGEYRVRKPEQSQ